MQRIHCDGIFAADLLQDTSFAKRHLLPEPVARIFIVRVRRAVALVFGQAIRLLRQRTPKSDVQLLNAAADKERGDAACQRARDEMERDFVAEFVERAVASLVDHLAVTRGMNIGLPAADKKTVEAIEIGVDVGFARRGKDPRHGTCDQSDGVHANHRDR
ncbi:hypothetical protein ACVWY3_001033 [Bradyrhizobium sp. USDA 4486]